MENVASSFDRSQLSPQAYVACARAVIDAYTGSTHDRLEAFWRSIEAEIQRADLAGDEYDYPFVPQRVAQEAAWIRLEANVAELATLVKAQVSAAASQAALRALAPAASRVRRGSDAA